MFAPGADYRATPEGVSPGLGRPGTGTDTADGRERGELDFSPRSARCAVQTFITDGGPDAAKNPDACDRADAARRCGGGQADADRLCERDRAAAGAVALARAGAAAAGRAAPRDGRVFRAAGSARGTAGQGRGVEQRLG